ncbi:hypothetical protein B0H10DRAFT_1979452 [Mycena sp. CBHHK59/15]|nr:hypothetical protein B0H10DRAFT_1979452 [Mycena sp. CBHHK59/15]
MLSHHLTWVSSCQNPRRPPQMITHGQKTQGSIMRSDIWHKDGSIVLQAQNTQFRVHWGVLSLHSSFFRDMQDLPQPPDQSNVEGCPIVELPDSAEDVEHLLKALYNPLFNQKSLPFSVVSSIFRLGRKYDFKDLLASVVERLAFEHPTSWKQYQELYHDSGIYSPSRIVPRTGIYLDFITLARENNLFSMLPCAYHRALLVHTQFQIFNGVTRRDGTGVAKLSSVDQQLCILAKSKLLQAQFEPGYTFGWLLTDSMDPSPEENDCTNLAECRRQRDSILLHLLFPSSYRGLTFLPPSLWARLCETCAGRAKASTEAGRQKMWEALPSFFDLPPWGELKNDL